MFFSDLGLIINVQNLDEQNFYHHLNMKFHLKVGLYKRNSTTCPFFFLYFHEILYVTGKREAEAEPLAKAEAEPEAEPLFFGRRYYTSPRYYGYGGHYSSSYGYYRGKRAAEAEAVSEPLFFGRRIYHSSPRYYGYGGHYGYYRGKRSAEAEPEAEPLFFGRRYYG